MTFSFKQGDAEWAKLRKRALDDLFWFSSVVLGYADLFPLEEETHRLFCDFLQRKTGVPDLDLAPIQKLEMPRGTGKTSCGTVGHAIQLACANPNIAILIANERQETADGFLAAIKSQFETNDLLRALFPEVIPPDFKATTWAASKATLVRQSHRPEPTFMTIGVGGTVTGTHPDVIIVDDPISKEAMENARVGAWQIMERVNRWCNALKLLLNTQAQPFPQIRFNGTRWYQNDTYDYIENTFGGPPEMRRTYRLSAKLPTGQTVSREAYRVGQMSVFRAAAIEESVAVFPKIHNLEKLAELRADDPELFSCFPPEQRILTGRGAIPIVEVGTGDVVRARDGHWYPVTNTLAKLWNRPLITFRAWGMAEHINVTEDHKLLASAGVRYRNKYVTPQNVNALKTGSGGAATRTLPKADWLEAGTLDVGDVLWTPINREEVWPADWPHEFRHRDIWFLIGHWIGDGSMSKNHKYPDQFSVSHVFNPRDEHLAQRIQHILRHRLGRKPAIGLHGSTLRLGYGHKQFARFLWSCRLGGNSQKMLPVWAESIPLSCQRALVAGYFSADGCTIRGRRHLTSVCLPLLEQMQRILARLNFVSWIQRSGVNKERGCRIHAKVYPAQQAYDLTFEQRKTRSCKVWLDGDWLCRRIRLIGKRDYQGTVHTLEAGGSYTLQGNVVARNCNMMNDPTSADVRLFQDKWIEGAYYDRLDGRLGTPGNMLHYKNDNGSSRHIHEDQLRKVMVVDPAFTAGGQGARAAIIVTGTDTEMNRHLVLEAIAKRAEARDLVIDILNTAKKHEISTIYIESVAQQAAFLQFVQNEARSRNMQITVEPVRPGGRNKDLRIESLSVFFKARQILFHRDQLDLLREYASFPKAKYKDLLDALAYAAEKWTYGGYGQTARTRANKQYEDYLARRGFQPT